MRIYYKIKYRNKDKQMKEYVVRFLDMWKDDYKFKTVISATLSALTGLFFTIFNGALGIVYRSVWNGSICVYYVALAVVRGIVVGAIRKDHHTGRSEEPDINLDMSDISSTHNKKNRGVYIGTHFILFFMDLALVAPIAYMVKGERSYVFGMIPAIVMAAYVTFRVTLGIINFKRSRRVENILIKELRTVGLQDSLVALLTLQNALIIASGDEMSAMIGLTSWTSAGVWGLILIITIISLIDGLKNSKA